MVHPPLLRGMLFLTLTAAAAGQDLVYVRRANREETRSASLAATLKKLPALPRTTWRTIGPVEVEAGPDGSTDIARAYTAANGAAWTWREWDLRDGQWHDLDESATWFYRTIESPEALSVTFTLGADRFIDLRLNGSPLQSYSTTMAVPGKLGRFGARLRKGTNRVLIRVQGTGQFHFDVTPADARLLEELDARLDEDFALEGERRWYRIETIDVPEEVVPEVGGLEFLPDGTLVVATRRGDLWSMKDGAWRRFASGLHEPLGLVAGKPGPAGGIAGAELFVLHRPELTRVVDADGDGAADRFETVCDAWGISVYQHEYLYGPVRDREGNFWCAYSGLGDAGTSRWLGWSFKVTPAGEFVPWSTGLRSPNGLVLDDEGELYIAENQGNWVGTSPLYHCAKGDFHGFPTGLRWDPSWTEGNPDAAAAEVLDRRRKPGAVLFPYGAMGQSLAQPVFDRTGGKFGPFAGQMFIADQSKSNVMRVVLETVGGVRQGACFPFRSGFQAGNNRLAFGPDGSLWVGQTDRGWQSIGGRTYGLQRLVWTGEVPFEVLTMSLTPAGFDLAFTKPVDPAAAADIATYAAQRYRYLYHATYGSPQVDVAPVAVTAARVSEDRRRVSIDLAEIREGMIHELNLPGLKAADGSPLLHGAAYYTVNKRRDANGSEPKQTEETKH